MENRIDLLKLTDDFIESELHGNDENIQSKNDFLIYYLSQQIKPYVNKNDTKQLLDIFNQYVYICLKYSIVPSSKMYCMLVSIPLSTFYESLNSGNVSSEFIELFKQVNDTCKTVVENKLSNTEKTNINLMFISKAVYGYTETSPVQRIERIDIQVNDIKSITNRYGNIKAIESSDT